MEFETLMKECPLIAILRGITPEEMEQVCDGIVGAHHEVEACLYHIEQQHGHKGERK